MELKKNKVSHASYFINKQANREKQIYEIKIIRDYNEFHTQTFCVAQIKRDINFNNNIIADSRRTFFLKLS